MLNFKKIRDSFFTYIFLLPFIEIESFSVFFDFKWEYFVLIDCVIIAVLALRDFKFSKVLIAPVILFLTILFSTMIRGNDIFPALYYPARLLFFALLIDYYNRRGKLMLFLASLKRLLVLLIAITVFFQFYDQDFFGYTVSYNYVNFLVSDNFLGFYYAILIYITYITKKHFDVECCLYSAICLISLVKAWTAASIVCFSVMIVMLLFGKTVSKFLTVTKSLIANMLLIASVLFFKIQYLFEWLIVGILNKSITLSYRTYVWESALNNILNEPLLGYGTVRTGRVSINTIILPNGTVHTFFSHNLFLEIMIQGGIIALVCFIILHFCANSALKTVPRNSYLYIGTVIAVFVMLFSQFSEFFNYAPITNLPLIMCFYCNKLIMEEPRNELQKTLRNSRSGL